MGIEGTAHTLGVGIVDDKGNILADVKKTYSPEEGGIHPREASRYMANNFGEAVVEALGAAGLKGTGIDLISFSQGPGLGPCLSNTGVGARALALSLDKPLMGVNHCVAHIEIGNLQASKEAKDWGQPLVLYVSGGNTQIIMLKDQRYRVFGETLDIGVGNMLDKFGRLVGLQHPAGPKIEKLAREGTKFIHLPYVVKGNDLSFSGLLTEALKHANNERLEDVCYSLQETSFAMMAEATERALCHLKSDSLLLTGGVANNKRLQEMLSIMAEDNDIPFSVPKGYCGDNGVMIAWTGLVMHRAGVKQRIQDTEVDQNFRTDKVEISWSPERKAKPLPMPGRWKGAEAILTKKGATVHKRRVEKMYRLPEIDTAVRKARTTREANLIKRASAAGVRTPGVTTVLKQNYEITMEFISDTTVSQYLDANPTAAPNIGKDIGRELTKLHDADIIHGDLTTSNILLDRDLVFIDFGLGEVSRRVEDKATDLLLLKKAMNANHSPIFDELWSNFLRSYKPSNRKEVLHRLERAEQRGRYF